MPDFKNSKGFQLRSGNKPNAPFKMMGSSPAKNEIFLKSGGTSYDAINSFSTKKKTPEIEDNTKVITIDESNNEKIKPQKLDIVNKDPKTGKDVKVGETNTSSRPDGEGPVTKEPKPNETKTEATEGKAEKKGLWGRYRDYVTNADGKGSYAKNQDSINEWANAVGDTDKHSTDNFAKVDASQQKEKDAKIKEIATADANKKDAINATQKAEMHASNLAKNAQDIERSKSLQKATEQGIVVAEDNISEGNKTESTEDTSKAVLTDGSGGGKNLNENA